MTSAVLDASAVIALVKRERGAAKVAAVLADAALGVFNHAEVISHFAHLGMPIEEIRRMLGSLPITVLAADEDISWDAGVLRPTTAGAGLSLGDRFCLALAKQLGVPAYTADRVWKDVAAACGVKVVTIR